MEYKDYYKTLNVTKTASKDDIKKSYRRLARKYHPDVSKVHDAEARFKEVNEAYDVLRDKKKRAEYDHLGRRGYNQHASSRGAEGFGAGGFSQGRSTDANAGFGDLFNSFFNNEQQSNPFGGGKSRASAPASQSATIRLDLEDVFLGATKTIRLPSGNSLDVKIPQGIEEGKKIRLRGKASTGGDLLLKIKLNTHPDYSVEGKDIYFTLVLAPWEAALGATIGVKTLAGSKIKLKIPAGAYTGQKMRLRGKGLPGNIAGDQYVVINILTPPVNTDADRELYQQMQHHFKWSPRN